MAPEPMEPGDIGPELMEPDDMEPDDAAPLLWVCENATVAAPAQRMMPSPAFLAKRSIGVLPRGRRTVAASAYSRDALTWLHGPAGSAAPTTNAAGPKRDRNR